MDASSREAKQQFRQTRKQALIERLQSWSEEQRRHNDHAIQQNLLQFLSDKFGLWGAYQALHLEPEITAVLHLPQLGFANWVYPKMEADQLIWVQPGARGFCRGPFGVQEPQVTGATIRTRDQLTGVLIPGLSFARSGYRLGHGKGYYDRALQGFAGFKVGVCYASQLETQIPAEPHDVKMDWLITESEIFRVG